jgi:hypothetical protein
VLKAREQIKAQADLPLLSLWAGVSGLEHDESCSKEQEGERGEGSSPKSEGGGGGEEGGKPEGGSKSVTHGGSWWGRGGRVSKERSTPCS